MKEYTTPLGRKIYVFEKVIPKDICEKLIVYTKNYNAGKILKDNTIPKELFEIYQTYCNPSPIEFIGYADNYTAGSDTTPIGLHVDAHYQNLGTWKVFFYLNDVPNGGTIFREGGQDVLIENSQGSVVVFDIYIPHLGDPKQPNIPKYTIGFRPVPKDGPKLGNGVLYSRFKKH